MNPVVDTCLKVAGYIGCLAGGALISWYFAKKHYDKIVAEEIESIRAVHNRKVEEPVYNKNNYEDTMSGYFSAANTTFSPAAPRPKEEQPYLIPMETFDDADPAFEKISLEYYTEDNCLIENDEPIDIDSSVGVGNLERFAKRMDLIVMYVRNEKIGVDYEVTKIVSRWSE